MSVNAEIKIGDIVLTNLYVTDFDLSVRKISKIEIASPYYRLWFTRHVVKDSLFAGHREDYLENIVFSQKELYSASRNECVLLPKRLHKELKYNRGKAETTIDAERLIRYFLENPMNCSACHIKK